MGCRRPELTASFTGAEELGWRQWESTKGFALERMHEGQGSWSWGHTGAGVGSRPWGLGGLCWDACCCSWEVEMSQLGGALGWDESPAWGCISVTAHTWVRIHVRASICVRMYVHVYANPHVCLPLCLCPCGVSTGLWAHALGVTGTRKGAAKNRLHRADPGGFSLHPLPT